MKEEKKDHYRNVFKSDHLSKADLQDMIEQGTSLQVTIAYVKQEYGARVAGKIGDFDIAYFCEKIKPMIINATNGSILEVLMKSPFVQDWNNIPVTLYINEKVSMAGRVGGVGIIPTKKKALQPISQERFLLAVEKIKVGKYSKLELRNIFALDKKQEATLNALRVIFEGEEFMKFYLYWTSKGFTKKQLVEEIVLSEEQLKKLGEL